MRYIIKGVYCLPDDGYYEEKANDGLTLFWLNRLKKLIKLGVPDIMLYSEIEQINNKIAYVSNKKRMAAELGCNIDELDKVIKQSLQEVIDAAPSDAEIDAVRNTVIERITKAVETGELPRVALNNLNKVKEVEVLIADKATLTIPCCAEGLGIILPITNRLNRACLSHEFMHISAVAEGNPIWHSLTKFMDDHEAYDHQIADDWSKAYRFCDILSEYVCEVMLNNRYFGDYISPKDDEVGANIFTDDQLQGAEKAIKVFGEKLFYGLYFGDATLDLSDFVDYISKELGEDAWVYIDDES